MVQPLHFHFYSAGPATYNNIPHREGIETGIQHIKNNIALLPENSPRTGTIQSFLNIILTNNNFQYCNKPWEQSAPHHTPPYSCKKWKVKFLTMNPIPLIFGVDS